MKSIYAVTNTINENVYIGCTGREIKRRFIEHKKESKKTRAKNKPLYKAMCMYGSEKFQVSLIETCEDKDAATIERKWIDYYRKLGQCYNIADGGTGKPLFNYTEILKKLETTPYPSKVAKDIGCSRDLVRNIAKLHGIRMKNVGQELNVNPKRKVYQYDINGKYIQEHDSVKEAVDWCVLNKKCKKQSSGARGKIAGCANGKHKTAFGCIWKYYLQ